MMKEDDGGLPLWVALRIVGGRTTIERSRCNKYSRVLVQSGTSRMLDNISDLQDRWPAPSALPTTATAIR